MTEASRCFVAVPLGDPLRAALSTAAARWRQQPPADQLRWAQPEAWHLTLAFLGPVAREVLPSVTAAIEGVAAAHPVSEVATGRLGAFHRPRSARVLWYGVADPAGRLAALAADLAGAIGLPAGEPFRPHVTLARARHASVDLRGWIEPASASAPDGALGVDRIELLRSHLGRGPARYETLAAFDLGGRG